MPCCRYRNKHDKKTYTLAVSKQHHAAVGQIAQSIGATRLEVTEYLLASALSTMQETLTKHFLEKRELENKARKEYMNKSTKELSKHMSGFSVIPL